ncbi:MAG: ferritin-like domain-containing protein [Chloroflexi bacterium]|nr:ferritin-like domain-containing protein [Chloroflexota bacterium]
MFNANTNPKFKENFVAYLTDIYTFESTFSKTLESYGERASAFKDFPEFRARIYQCAEMCKEHSKHLLPRLEFYNVRPSVKATDTKEQSRTFSSFTSPILSCMDMVKPETLAGFATTWYTFGHFKIASYKLLTTLARTFGDEEVARLSERHMHEEMETQRWLFEHMPEIGLFNLQNEGIPVPQNAWAFVREPDLVGTSAAFSPRK